MWTHRHLLCIWGYVIYLFLKLFLLWPLGARSVANDAPVTSTITVAFWTLLHFLSLQYAPCSFCIFLAPAWESTISSGSRGSFSLVNGIRKHDLGASCIDCYYNVIALSLLRWHNKYVHVCHSHMYKYFHMSRSVFILSSAWVHIDISHLIQDYMDNSSPLPCSSVILDSNNEKMRNLTLTTHHL